MASAWWTFVWMEEHALLIWALIGATVQVDFKGNIVKVIEKEEEVRSKLTGLYSF